jgi:methionine-rich copper-binding protein CopC
MKRVVLGLLLIASLLACGTQGVTPQTNGNSGGDTTAPTLTSSTPANTAVSVAVNTNITLFFSEKMDTTSVSVTSDPNSDLGGAAWNAAATEVSFDPPTNLEVSSDYTLSIVGKDVSGNALAATSLQFTTAGDSNPAPPLDTTAPSIASSSPANGSTNAAINSNILITFSEAMNPSSITVSLNPSVNLGAPSFKSENSAIEFNPPADLGGDLSYAVTVTGKDVAGNTLTGSSSFTFKTTTLKDTTPPAIPKNLNAYAGDGKITFAWDTNTEPDLKGYTLYYSNNASNLSNHVFISAANYTKTLTGLTNGQIYFYQLEAEDGAGNRSDRTITKNATPKDLSSPKLLSSTPRNGATGVLTTSNIVLNFSETMNPSTSTFGFDCIKGPTGCGTNWATAWSNSNKTVTFSNLMAGGLLKGATYRAFINARDLNGNLLSQLFSFVVETDLVPPTVVSASPDAFAIGQPATVVLQINFSKPMDRVSVETAFKASLTNGGAPVTGTFFWDNADKTVTLQPSTPLPYGENVNWSLNPGVKDEAGNALQGTFGRIMRVIQRVTVDMPYYGSGHVVYTCTGVVSIVCDYLKVYTQTGVIRIGDRDNNDRSMGFLAFKINSIPTNATITAAKLQVFHKDTSGNPFGELGQLILERVNPSQVIEQPYGLSKDAPRLPALPCSGCPKVILSTAIDQDVLGYVRADKASFAGASQFRLRFTEQFTDDGNGDYLDYYQNPVLTVTYEYP